MAQFRRRRVTGLGAIRGALDATRDDPDATRDVLGAIRDALDATRDDPDPTRDAHDPTRDGCISPEFSSCHTDSGRSYPPRNPPPK